MTLKEELSQLKRDQNDVRKGLVVSQEMPKQPPEARKGKGMDCPQGTEGPGPADTLTSAQ